MPHAPHNSPALSALVHAIVKNHSQFDTKRIEKALAIASDVYGSSLHWSGELTISHVSGTLERFMAFEPDEDAIIACILHHILDFNNWTLIELEEQFGPKIRALVSSIHLLGHVSLRGDRSSVSDLRLMLLTVSDDVRTLLIGLCGHCRILQCLHNIDHENAVQFCQDVLQLYAPVAARLGIYSVKHELESGAFPMLYSTDANRIQGQLLELHGRYGDFFDDVLQRMEQYLEEHGVHASMAYRQKQLYSIFMKMRKKNFTHIEDVTDLFAVRVIVDSIEDCYSTLGMLHQLGRPVPHRFKDYISFPKPNGYQSLHTTLMQIPGAPENVSIEVQIRTQEMHRESEFGVAAHWSYKEGGAASSAMKNVQVHRILAAQEQMEEESGVQFFDHIYVLTPQGDVIELPESATPLDFAFLIHTELGLSFKGAKVNGVMVPIHYQLENGDVVEILKHTAPRPSSQWLQLLKMSSSKAKLKRYLYAQERPQLLSQGKKLLNEQLRRRHLPLLDTDLEILKKCDGRTLTLTQREDLLIKIGQGSEKASALFERLDGLKKDVPTDKITVEIPLADLANAEKVVVLEGGMNMPVQCAKCCKPDVQKSGSIVGIIHRAGKVMIHKPACKMLRNANPDRKIQAKWESLYTKKLRPQR